MTPERAVRRRRTRRIVGGLAAACAAATFVVGPTAGAEDKPFETGVASATARSYRINPTASGLSVGIGFGVSAAGYQNKVGQAESRAIDLGVVGTTLAAEGCDGKDPTLPADKQPQSLRVDSRENGAAQGKTQQEQYAPFITKYARATDAPEGEAVTTTLPLDIPGAVSASGAVSRTLVHVVNGTTREAVATVDIASLDLGGGQVKLSGLHWEARHRSGSDAKPAATFTLGKLVVGGKDTPVPADPKTLADTVNSALKPLGIVLRAPAFHNNSGILFVDPLAIAVVPSQQRDDATNGLLDAAYPARKSLTDALFQATCHTGDVLTVVDIVVGSMSGAGQFSVELGGVQATTGELGATSFLQSYGPAPDVPGALPLGTDTAPLPAASLGGQSSVLGATATPGHATSTGAKGSGSTSLHAVPAAITGTRGGRLALVGLAGLGLVALLVEGDRRMMRRARRTIPMEEP